MEGSDQRPAGVAAERPAPSDLAAILDGYFAERGLGVRVARIAAVLGGFETYIYRLELTAVTPAPAPDGQLSAASAGSAGDPPTSRTIPLAGESPALKQSLLSSGHGSPMLPVGAPLIIRLGWRADAGEAFLWEARAMGAARDASIPVPHVYLVEPCLPDPGAAATTPAPASEMGPPSRPGPARRERFALMIMEFAPGVRLDEAALSAGILDVIRMTRAYARMQAAIYRVPWRPDRAAMPDLSGSALAPFASIEERLAGLRAEIDARNLPFLRPVLRWLEDHSTVIERRPRVFLHGDCHPLNLFVNEKHKSQITAVIDWSAAGFGDRHEDIGWSSMLIATATSAVPAEDRRLGAFRSVGRWLYLFCLHRACRLDRTALRYGEVYAALRWMLIFLPSYLPNAGPPILNVDAPAFTIPLYVKRVQRFIEKRTALRLVIPDP